MTPHPDPLADRLALLGTDHASPVQLAPATGIRARGDRRRARGRAALGTAGAAVLLLGGAGAWATLSPSDRGAATAAGSAGSGRAADGAAAEHSGPGLGAGSPRQGPAAPQPLTTSGATDPVAACLPDTLCNDTPGLPAGPPGGPTHPTAHDRLLLPTDAGRARSAHWLDGGDPGQLPLVAPCPGTADPVDDERVDRAARLLTSRGAGRLEQSVDVYPDEAAATRVVRAYTDAVRRCPGADGSRWELVGSRPVAGLPTVVLHAGPGCPTCDGAARSVAVLRDGATVSVVVHTPGGRSVARDDVLPFAEQAARVLGGG